MHIPSPDSHKGDNGVLLVVGGSKRYHGAPLLSLLAARRFVDLLYFVPGERDPYLISAIKRIPEVIVDAPKRIPDCVLYGPGLHEARPSIPKAPLKVFDGDGLYVGKEEFEGNVITPNEREFTRLFNLPPSKENVRAMAKKYKCVIVKKGKEDVVSDGEKVLVNREHNAGLTKGGTGDVLAGLIAALCCTHPPLTACWIGVKGVGIASNLLKSVYGFNYCASDVAEKLGEVVWKLKI